MRLRGRIRCLFPKPQDRSFLGFFDLDKAALAGGCLKRLELIHSVYSVRAYSHSDALFIIICP
jgi:hypothetical protein